MWGNNFRSDFLHAVGLAIQRLEVIEKFVAQRFLGFFAGVILGQFLTAGMDVGQQFLIAGAPFFEAFRFTLGLVVDFEEGEKFEQQILTGLLEKWRTRNQ